MSKTNSQPVIQSAATWQQLAARVRQAISRGELHPGQVLPSLDAFAREQGVGRTTAQHALKSLANEGWLVRRRRAGTIVNPNRTLPRPFVAVLARPLLLIPASPYTCVAVPALVHHLVEADLPARFFHHVMIDSHRDPFAHLVEDDLSSLIEQGRVCGLIVLGQIPDHHARLLGQIQYLPLPLVECSINDPSKLRSPVVIFDYFSLARHLVESVRRRGAQRIATIVGPVARDHDMALALASVQAMNRRCMPAELQVRTSAYRPAESFAATRMLLTRPKPPDAIVVFDDLLALGVDEALTQDKAAARRRLFLATQANLGARLPYKQRWERVSFDPWEQMALAVRLLQKLIKGQPVPRAIERLQPVDAAEESRMEESHGGIGSLIVPLGHMPDGFAGKASGARRRKPPIAPPGFTAAPLAR